MRSDEAILKRLENKALHYLGRYASTEARLRQVLGRFAQRKMAEEEPNRMTALIDQMVEDCRAKGYVNDKSFAEQKTASLRRGGASRLQIKRKLYERGVDRRVIDVAIAQHDDDQEHDPEVQAALIYARKRRLGPYRKPPIGQTEMKDGWQERHYASLARAGFSAKTVGIIMALDDTTAAENLLEEGYFY
jgi:regulatory protein